MEIAWMSFILNVFYSLTESPFLAKFLAHFQAQFQAIFSFKHVFNIGPISSQKFIPGELNQS